MPSSVPMKIAKMKQVGKKAVAKQKPGTPKSKAAAKATPKKVVRKTTSKNTTKDSKAHNPAKHKKINRAALKWSPASSDKKPAREASSSASQALETKRKPNLEPEEQAEDDEDKPEGREESDLLPRMKRKYVKRVKYSKKPLNELAQHEDSDKMRVPQVASLPLASTNYLSESLGGATRKQENKLGIASAGDEIEERGTTAPGDHETRMANFRKQYRHQFTYAESVFGAGADFELFEGAFGTGILGLRLRSQKSMTPESTKMILFVNPKDVKWNYQTMGTRYGDHYDRDARTFTWETQRSDLGNRKLTLIRDLCNDRLAQVLIATRAGSNASEFETMGTASHVEVLEGAKFMVKPGATVQVDAKGRMHARLREDCLPKTSTKYTQKVGQSSMADGLTKSTFKPTPGEKQWIKEGDLEKLRRTKKFCLNCCFTPGRAQFFFVDTVKEDIAQNINEPALPLKAAKAESTSSATATRVRATNRDANNTSAAGSAKSASQHAAVPTPARVPMVRDQFGNILRKMTNQEINAKCFLGGFYAVPRGPDAVERDPCPLKTLADGEDRASIEDSLTEEEKRLIAEARADLGLPCETADDSAVFGGGRAVALPGAGGVLVGLQPAASSSLPRHTADTKSGGEQQVGNLLGNGLDTSSEQKVRKYMISNRELHARTKALNYRDKAGNKINRQFVLWEHSVMARRVGSQLVANGKYLPCVVDGKRVAFSDDEAKKADIAEGTGKGQCPVPGLDSAVTRLPRSLRTLPPEEVLTKYQKCVVTAPRGVYSAGIYGRGVLSAEKKAALTLTYANHGRTKEELSFASIAEQLRLAEPQAIQSDAFQLTCDDKANGEHRNALHSNSGSASSASRIRFSAFDDKYLRDTVIAFDEDDAISQIPGGESAKEHVHSSASSIHRVPSSISQVNSKITTKICAAEDTGMPSTLVVPSSNGKASERDFFSDLCLASEDVREFLAHLRQTVSDSEDDDALRDAHSAKEAAAGSGGGFASPHLTEATEMGKTVSQAEESHTFPMYDKFTRCPAAGPLPCVDWEYIEHEPSSETAVDTDNEYTELEYSLGFQSSEESALDFVDQQDEEAEQAFIAVHRDNFEDGKSRALRGGDNDLHDFFGEERGKRPPGRPRVAYHVSEKVEVRDWAEDPWLVGEVLAVEPDLLVKVLPRGTGDLERSLPIAKHEKKDKLPGESGSVESIGGPSSKKSRKCDTADGDATENGVRPRVVGAPPADVESALPLALPRSWSYVRPLPFAKGQEVSVEDTCGVWRDGFVCEDAQRPAIQLKGSLSILKNYFRIRPVTSGLSNEEREQAAWRHVRCTLGRYDNSEGGDSASVAKTRLMIQDGEDSDLRKEEQQASGSKRPKRVLLKEGPLLDAHARADISLFSQAEIRLLATQAKREVDTGQRQKLWHAYDLEDSAFCRKLTASKRLGLLMSRGVCAEQLDNDFRKTTEEKRLERRRRRFARGKHTVLHHEVKGPGSEGDADHGEDGASRIDDENAKKPQSVNHSVDQLERQVARFLRVESIHEPESECSVCTSGIESTWEELQSEEEIARWLRSSNIQSLNAAGDQGTSCAKTDKAGVPAAVSRDVARNSCLLAEFRASRSRCFRALAKK